MFDSRAWVHRAQSFGQSLRAVPGAQVESLHLEPPLGVHEADALGRVLRRPLPAALRAFLVTGSAGLDCRYTYAPGEDAETAELSALFPDQTSIYGGARLCAAEQLADYAQSCAEWASETWVSEEPAQAAVWRSALPFAALDNGDYLALDVRQPADDPPVLYLSHDDESLELAASFTEFLAVWERLCYLGPEIWLLAEFLTESKHLNADGQKAERLRRLLGH